MSSSASSASFASRTPSYNSRFAELPPPPSLPIPIVISQQLKKRNKALRDIHRLENGIIRRYFAGELPKLSSVQRVNFFELLSIQDNDGLNAFIEEHKFLNSTSRTEYITTHGFEDGDNGYYDLASLNTNVYDNMGPADLSNEWKVCLFYKGRACASDFETVKKYYLAGRLDELDPNGFPRGEGLCRFDGENPVDALSNW